MVSIFENQMKSCGSRIGPMNKIIYNNFILDIYWEGFNFSYKF
jgi:hypothetical protein